MAADLAAAPRTRACASSSAATRTSRTSAASPPPSATCVFDVNDFDETLPGPWEWDVKRLAASLEIAGARARLRRQAMPRAQSSGGVRAYREAMRALRRDAQPRRLVRAPRRRADRRPGPAGRHRARSRSSASRRTSPRRARRTACRRCRKLTERRRRRAADRQRPAADRAGRGARCPTPTQRRAAAGHRASCSARYRDDACPDDRRHLLERYRFVDLARKVVGVGSVGTRSWVVLLVGRDEDDPLFLQFKEAQASVLEPYAGASQFANQRPAGRRGPAADAGRQRHLPRLAARASASTGSRATSTCASSGTGSARPTSRRMAPDAAARSTAALRLDARPRPRPLGRPRRDRAPTSARASAFDRAPSPTSPPPTPTRTSSTTRRSSTPSPTGAWRRRRLDARATSHCTLRNGLRGRFSDPRRALCRAVFRGARNDDRSAGRSAPIPELPQQR